MISPTEMNQSKADRSNRILTSWTVVIHAIRAFVAIFTPAGFALGTDPDAVSNLVRGDFAADRDHGSADFVADGAGV